LGSRPGEAGATRVTLKLSRPIASKSKPLRPTRRIGADLLPDPVDSDEDDEGEEADDEGGEQERGEAAEGEAGAGPLVKVSKQIVKERERAGRPPVRLGKRGRGRPSKAETALRRMGGLAVEVVDTLEAMGFGRKQALAAGEATGFRGAAVAVEYLTSGEAPRRRGR
jgi:hypothetical protein